MNLNNILIAFGLTLFAGLSQESIYWYLQRNQYKILSVSLGSLLSDDLCIHDLQSRKAKDSLGLPLLEMQRVHGLPIGFWWHVLMH